MLTCSAVQILLTCTCSLLHLATQVHQKTQMMPLSSRMMLIQTHRCVSIQRQLSNRMRVKTGLADPGAGKFVGGEPAAKPDMPGTCPNCRIYPEQQSPLQRVPTIVDPHHHATHASFSCWRTHTHTHTATSSLTSSSLVNNRTLTQPCKPPQVGSQLRPQTGTSPLTCKPCVLGLDGPTARAHSSSTPPQRLSPATRSRLPLSR